jgi:hypothetical protein
MRWLGVVLLAGCGFTEAADINHHVANDLSVERDGGGASSGHSGPFVLELSPTPQKLAAVWGSSSGDVYALSADGIILHTSGDGTWSTQLQPTTTVSYYALGGGGAGNVYAGGYVPCGSLPCAAQLLHSTGDGQWTPVALPTGTTGSLWAVAALDTGEAYAAGGLESNGLLHTDDGVTWKAETVDLIYNLLPVGPGRAYAVSTNKVYLRDPSGTWTVVLDATPNDGNLQVMGASSPTDLYVAAYENAREVIYHSMATGTPGWTMQPTGVDLGNPIGVGVVSASEIYLACEDGLLQSSGDGQWTTVLAHQNLEAFYAAPDGQLYLVGDGGLILHRL